MKKIRISVVLALSAFLFFACNDNDTSNAYLEVRLTDAPGDYQEVNIDVQDVQVNNGSDDNGWKSLDANKGVYNILELTNGLDTLLGSVQLPAGHISQVRLVLGANNSIKMDGQLIKLSTPSAQQSGLKLLVDSELLEGVSYKLLLDFDAARSIVKAGSSEKYNLKPVIRTIVEAGNGAVKGTVSPVAATPAIYAINGMDTLGTAYPDNETGKFIIKGLSAGIFNITFEPSTGYQSLIKNDVTVKIGEVTDLGVISIPTN